MAYRRESEDLERQIDAFNSGYEKGGADWFQYFAEDATVFGPGSTEPIKGRAAYERNFTDLLTQEKRRVEVLNRDVSAKGDTAIAMQLLNVTQGGVETILRETTIWRREGDAWRIVHMDASTVGIPRPTESLKDVRTIRVLSEKVATVSSQIGVAQ